MSWVLKAQLLFRQKSQGRAVGQRDQLCRVPRCEGTCGWATGNGWKGSPGGVWPADRQGLGPHRGVTLPSLRPREYEAE